MLIVLHCLDASFCSRPKQTHNYPKVPTCNLYGPGSKEILEWGYTAKVSITKPPFKNHVLLSKYKLHLDDASGPHPPLPNGLTVVDAIADYLRLFHAHVVQVWFLAARFVTVVVLCNVCIEIPDK